MNEVDNFDNFPEFEDDEEIEEEPPSIFYKVVEVIVALLLVLGVLYIYGGVREFFTFRETPDTVYQVPTETLLNLEEKTLPLKVFIFRNQRDGSEKEFNDVERLVREASVVWNQADINFELESVSEIYLSDQEINNFLTSYSDFIRDFEHLSDDAINVFLLRRLAGVNGVAFPGLKTLAVADLSTNYDFRVLAHEVGHMLGLGHDISDKNRLMHQGSGGYTLTEEEIIISREFLNNF